MRLFFLIKTGPHEFCAERKGHSFVRDGGQDHEWKWKSAGIRDHVFLLFPLPPHNIIYPYAAYDDSTQLESNL